MYFTWVQNQSSDK